MGRAKKRSKRRSMIKGIIVGDADILVGLYFKNDLLHSKITAISKKLIGTETRIIFPNTTIIEALTTLQRKLSLPVAAALLCEHYQKGELDIEYVSEEIMQEAAEFYNLYGSKQNPFFDAVVAATAKQYSAVA